MMASHAHLTMTARSPRAHQTIIGTIVRVASTPTMCQTADECVTLGW